MPYRLFAESFKRKIRDSAVSAREAPPSFAVRHRFLWSAEELAAMKRLRAEGLHPREIGQRLGRTAGSVEDKLWAAGLYLSDRKQYLIERRASWATSEALEYLQRWYPDRTGPSTIRIGLRFGVSKNAIIGMAHRLGLTRGPSPIIYGKAPRVSGPRPLPPGAHTLPPLPSELAA